MTTKTPIYLFPAISILFYFCNSFNLAEKHLSRTRELKADKEGAAITSKITFATALVKVCAFSPIWDSIDNLILEYLKKETILTSIPDYYAFICQHISNKNVLTNLNDTVIAHPTDSHPPLSTRIEALGINFEEASNEALNITPEISASQIIDNYEMIEEEITHSYQTYLLKNQQS